jgi:hypothetical protein
VAKAPPVQSGINPIMTVVWLVTGAILLTGGLWLAGTGDGTLLGALVALLIGGGWAVLTNLPALERRLGLTAGDQRRGAFVGVAILVLWFAARPLLGDGALAYLLIGMGAYGVVESAVRLLRRQR